MMSRTYQTGAVLLVCVLVLAVISRSNSASTVSLTSSVERQGRQAACPGEEVTFTCMVDDGTSLEWISEAFSDAPEQFSLFDTDDEVGVSRMYDQFTTNLTRLVPDPGNPGFGDFTSTLEFIAAAEHHGIVIQCTDRITTPLSVSLTVITIMVSAPLNPVVRDFSYQQDRFTVVVEWTYPDSGPTPDMFSVLVSTGESTTSTQTVPGNETSVALTLLYNVDYTVGITATLCGETSAPTTTSISEAGCEGPGAPSNGDILQFESSEEGAVIVYQCSPGYSPTGPRNSTCTANGWTPNPADVDCSSAMQTGAITLGSSSSSPSLITTTVSVQSTVPVQTTVPIPSGSNTGPPDQDENSALSCDTRVSIAVVVTFVVVFTLGNITGALVLYCIICTVRRKSCDSTKQEPQPPAPEYEQVSLGQGKIELRENVAYGPI